MSMRTRHFAREISQFCEGRCLGTSPYVNPPYLIVPRGRSSNIGFGPRPNSPPDRGPPCRAPIERQGRRGGPDAIRPELLSAPASSAVSASSAGQSARSEEHTSELQSPVHLV